jgi:hypothetical protein
MTEYTKPLANNLYDHVQKKLELMWQELIAILNTEPLDEQRYIELANQYQKEFNAHMNGIYTHVPSSALEDSE